MQLSSNPLNKTIEKQLSGMFYGILAELSSPEEIKTILKDILTEGERVAILKRLGIAVYLDKGRNYEDIKNNIKVSSATIASVAENTGNPGWQEVIRRIKADEWASEWTNKISKGIRRILPR
ncbi:MAG TPA: Trp family transcriptional regulator [Candidatus Woesebacteria bacterium]|nr:Trp family transcriptional regulator [Candidatus Woesebacteria bacterium]